MATTAVNMPAAAVNDEVVTESKYRKRYHIRTAAVELILAFAMAVAAGLLLWGANFGHNMVRDNLVDQKIQFPSVAAMGDLPTKAQLTPYAEQWVDNGDKAKAYANLYIAQHLKTTNEGKTYSETSSQARAARTAATTAKTNNAPNAAELDKTATDLEGKVQTLFRGETLRGLLLYAYGWSLVADIAYWVGIAAVIGAVLLFGLAGYGFFAAHKDNKRMTAAQAEAKV